VAETAAGRPAAGARRLRSALRLLDREGDDPEAVALTGAVLVSLAHAEAEQGRGRHGLELLDRAEELLPGRRGLVLQQRGLLLLRMGRTDEALPLLNRAVPLLAAGGATDELVLIRTLLNRGNLHAYAGRIGPARDDLVRCRAMALAAGRPLLAAKAQHNLGSCDLLSGNVPAALQAYGSAADEYARVGEGFLAALWVDRARALLAAGLARAAGRDLDAALLTARRLRLDEDYAEAELARAQAALAAGDPTTARSWAGRAERRFRRRGNEGWSALAGLLRLRADVEQSGPTPARAERAGALAVRLRELGLPHDAEYAQLIRTRLLLGLGPVAEARQALPPARRGRPDQTVETGLLRQLVRAEIAAASGDRADVFRQLRTGLRALDRHRRRLGSVDLQAGVSGLGLEIAKAGLETALETGRPRLVFDWSEATRAQAFRVRPVLPPLDAALTAGLAELRSLRRTLREAELAGRPPGGAEARRIRELERALSERSWTAPGAGTSAALPTPDELAAELDGDGPERVLVSLLSRQGRLLGLVLGGGRVRLVPLGSRARFHESARRLLADLDAAAARQLPARLAEVVHASIRTQLSILTDEVIAPLRSRLGDRELVMVASTLVPWGLLPDVRGRPVTVAPSAAVWLSARRRWRTAAAAGPPVLVGGPDLAHAPAEVERVRAAVPEATVLTGSAATVGATLAALDGARLAHLAAHGTHEGENVLFSRLDLVDGPVMAYDVLSLRQVPRHAVLSACDLGRAAVRPGDEVLGFTAALLHAGCAAVVSSPARVRDELVPAVMAAYHAAVAAGRSPAAALAAATAAEPLCPFLCFGAG
jgi:tetratricopeptide (TPR) repeat protein